MPLLNFKKQFVPAIRSGSKRHTIRADRKVPIKPGDKLYLYCGARTKGCFKILPAPVTCSMVQSIAITNYFMVGATGWVPIIFVDGAQLAPDECNQLAYADGFSDFADMMKFWAGRFPFQGQIIHWRIDTLENYDSITKNPER
jgi:hypothetical protein